MRPIRRLAMLTTLVAALLALTSSSALAASVATTENASSVTKTTAILNGIVATGGVVTNYEFQYGTSTTYTGQTTIQQIPAGQGTVSVSAQITKLSPGTKYHFRLVALQKPGPYYYTAVSYGADNTFTTVKQGKVILKSAKLTVRKGKTSVRLQCTSGATCKGKLRLTERVRAGKHKFKTVTFGSKSFSIGAGRTSSVGMKISKAGLKTLRRARHHRLKAKLAVRPSTGQHKYTRTVKVTLK
jgi:hypothetical protein